MNDVPSRGIIDLLVRTAKRRVDTPCGTFGVRSLSDGNDHTVFLHGWMHSALIWDRIPDEMLSTRAVTMIDLPGFGGESLRDPSASREAIGAALIDVLATIDKQQPIKTVVADSLGAILFVVGLREQSWLSGKSVFFSGVPFDGLPGFARWLPIRTLLPTAIRLIKVLPRILGKALVGSNLWFTVQLQSTVGDEIYASVLGAEPLAAKHYFTLLSSPLTRAEMANRLKFAERAIITRGQFDRIVSRETTRVWAEVIGAEDCEIPGVGHTPMIEASKHYFRSVRTMSC